jgi:cytochrome b subunit of formate dehydrogenase
MQGELNSFSFVRRIKEKEVMEKAPILLYVLVFIIGLVVMIICLPFVVVMISGLMMSFWESMLLEVVSSRESVEVASVLLACTFLIMAVIMTMMAVISELFVDLRGRLISKPELEAQRAELEASRAKVIAELEADRAKARDR